jgi:uncharacterized protein (DUF1778 family)
MTKSRDLRHLRIAFRLSPNEHEIISWAANVLGMSTSEFVRNSALERAGRTMLLNAVPQELSSLQSTQLDPAEREAFVKEAEGL